MAVKTYQLRIEITDDSGNIIPGSSFNVLHAGSGVHFDRTSGVSGNAVSVTLTDQDVIKLQGAFHRPASVAGSNWQAELTSGLESQTIILSPSATVQTFASLVTLDDGTQTPSTGGGGAYTGPTHGMIISGTHRMIHKFNMNGKVLTHIRYGGKTLTLIDPVYGTKPPTGGGGTTGKNTYTGTFVAQDHKTAAQKEAEYNAITTSVARYQFHGQRELTSISLPKVKTIGNSAFEESHKLTTVDLPEATLIGTFAFQHAPITSLNIPKADDIGDYAFNQLVNAPTTHVTMPAKFNRPGDKDRIFGSGYWDKVTFTWV